MAQQASPNWSGQMEFLRPQLYSSCMEVTQTPCRCSSLRSASSICPSLMLSSYKSYKVSSSQRVIAHVECNNVTVLTLLTSAAASAPIANNPCPMPTPDPRSVGTSKSEWQ